MLTTGTKLLVGATVAAFVAAIVYGLAKNGTLGVVGLLSAATALGLLAGINLVARDSNVSAMDAEAVVEAPASRSAPSPSLWPLVVAGGAGLIVFGLVTEQAFFLLGVILVGLGMFEWMLEAWSERASADVAFNREARGRLS
ncbi:MAG: cytochrome c oxidase subunit 4, partial [Acidimicrobiia bacterium]|nr:cytochrome c oxidase subunit 4 [Acidimicrobiia bacterium]